MRLREYIPYWLALGIFLCTCPELSAQQPQPAAAATAPAAPTVKVRAGFVEDSLSVGRDVSFYITARYDRKLNMLFPDTTFNFSPFDFKHKSYFTTETEGHESYDSVVYHLTTFEVDSLLYLSLPVYQINPQDCTTFRSNQDSIRLAHVITSLPDSLSRVPLKMNVAYQDVPYAFNVQLWVIIGGLLLMTVAAVWFAFGKNISRRYRLKRMQKAHAQFIEVYTQEVNTVSNAFSTEHTETALILWKRYMEQLEGQPYTKLTTKEIIWNGRNEALGRSLKTVDGAIYGHETAVVDSLQSLKTYAVERFNKKIQEVTNG